MTIPANRGFRARVAELLRDLVDAVRTDTAPPDAALGLVNLTTLPVYRVANAAAAYRGAVIDQEMDALAEAVALDVMQVWITDLHRTVEERAGTLDIADGEQLQSVARGAAVQPGGARPSPPPGPPAAQHGARRGREAAADRDRAGGRALGRSARRTGLRARRRRAPGRGRRADLYICTSSSPSAAATYLVDLLNAVAAIASGGAYINARPARRARRASPGCCSAPPSAGRGRTTPSGSCCSSPSGAR